MSRFVHLLHCFAQENPNRKRITYLCGQYKIKFTPNGKNIL